VEVDGSSPFNPTKEKAPRPLILLGFGAFLYLLSCHKMDTKNGLTPILTPTPKGAENTEKDEAFQGVSGF
jgi:hypothetical protein